jgi:hypothetical protein
MSKDNPVRHAEDPDEERTVAMVAYVRAGAEPPAASEIEEQRRLVTVNQSSTGDSRVAERNLARRMLIGIALAIPVGAGLYVVLVALALRGSGTPLTAALLMGAGIGTFAALFWGFWFGIAASVREIEEIEARARRRPRT